MKICSFSQCTGCGMCTNICPQNAITMIEEEHGFLVPIVNEKKCLSCGLCIKKCPANLDEKKESTFIQTYAAWNINNNCRKKSTSGGVCSLFEDIVFETGGGVAGVRWNCFFQPVFSIALNKKQAESFRGSKYVQSYTGKIYNNVKEYLKANKSVLFVGTPCQIAALKSYLGIEYDKLYCIDLVCHGVPPYASFEKYLKEISSKYKKKIVNVRFRYKNPYWDYCSVRIDFEDKTYYQKYTFEDCYFNLFNMGYILRDSCHNCKYASLHREGDITLSDYWGYRPSSFRMRDYNNGVSLVVINSEKGVTLFNKIKQYLIFEPTSYDSAVKTNKSFLQPYSIPDDKLQFFWNDYDSGESMENLYKKHISNPPKLPNFLFLRRLKARYNWIFRSIIHKNK